MGDFIMCIAQYVIIMIVLAGLAFTGAKLGISRRKVKDAKINNDSMDK